MKVAPKAAPKLTVHPAVDRLVAIGDLHGAQLDSPSDALEQYRLVLEDDPSNDHAIAAARGIGEAREELRLDAADILEPVLRAGNRHEELVLVLELRLRAQTDPSDRAKTLRAIASVEDEGRGVVRPSPLLPGMSPGPRRPVITYRVGDRDAARVKRGIEILARLFLRVGAQVVLACRNTDKGAAAAATMPGDVEVRRLDLQDLSSVREFADGVTGVDVLINNAGIMAVPYALTADGFESQIGTNHLGHFALTAQLLPVLQRTAGSRVVVKLNSVSVQWWTLRTLS